VRCTDIVDQQNVTEDNAAEVQIIVLRCCRRRCWSMTREEDAAQVQVQMAVFKCSSGVEGERERCVEDTGRCEDLI
jgi:hypothetical protein